MTQKICRLRPPEAAPALDVAGNKENGDGYLHATCQGKRLSKVIVVSIIEGQSQHCAPLFPPRRVFLRLVQRLQRGLKVQGAIMAEQGEQGLSRRPSPAAGVTEDHQ